MTEPAQPLRAGRANRKPHQNEAPGPDRKAAARALYEGQPGATCETVAAEMRVPVGTVRRWKSEGDWRPLVKSLPDLSARAGALADSFRTKMADLGKPLDDETAAAEAAREVSTEFAVDVRAQVLDRHRKEWAAPRKIAYEAIQQAGRGDVPGGFERAKLAKITSETLTLIQTGECRAYGIGFDARAGDTQTVVVVDRGPAAVPAIESSPGTDTGTDDGGEF